MSRSHFVDTRKIEKYQPIGPLDKGGMGRVFDGRIDFPAHLSRRCALKFMRHDRSHDVRYVALFLREAMIGWDVSGHPNIVTTRNFVQRRDGRLCIVLDKEGPALDRCFEELQGRHARVRVLAENMLCALRHLRRKRVVHSDISLANILLSPDGVAKLNDFGLARHEDEISSDRFESPSCGFVGVAAYASPKVAVGERPDHRSDLYSLGAVLYELVTSRPANGDPEPLPAPVPADLAELITGLMQHDPEDRISVESALDILHRSDQPSASREEITRVATEWIAKDEAERGQPARVETAVKWFDAAAAYMRRWPSQTRRQGSWDIDAHTNGDPAASDASDADDHDPPADGDLPPAQSSVNGRGSISLPRSSLWIVVAAAATIALTLAVQSALQRLASPTPVALELVAATPSETNDARSADAIPEISGDTQEQPAVQANEPETAEADEPSTAKVDELETIEADPPSRHPCTDTTAPPGPTREYRASKRKRRANPRFTSNRVHRRYKLSR